MAQLPPDGEWLVQQHDGVVTIFNQYTQEEILYVNANDGNAMAQAQKVIFDAPQLNAEQKCFAHFWFGYFYGHATAFAKAGF